TLASVLKQDPDWSALPQHTPRSIHTLLRRCLNKDRKQRLQAIGEARIVLEVPSGTEVPLRVEAHSPKFLWPVVAAVLLAALSRKRPSPARTGCPGMWRTRSYRQVVDTPQGIRDVDVERPLPNLRQTCRERSS